MFKRDLLIWHDLGQVLQQTASPNHEPFIQLVGLEVELLVIHHKPALDVVEVKEGLLGGLDDPLLLHLQVLARGAQHLLLVTHRRVRPAVLFNLRDSPPANSKAVIVRVDDILLL